MVKDGAIIRCICEDDFLVFNSFQPPEGGNEQRKWRTHLRQDEESNTSLPSLSDQRVSGKSG